MEKIHREPKPPDGAHPAAGWRGKAVVQAPLQPIDSVLLPQVPLLEWHHLPLAGVLQGQSSSAGLSMPCPSQARRDAAVKG